MTQNKKVVWTEGMFLTPHHFHQWDRYHESLLNQRFGDLNPFGWGVTRLEIDLDAIANGTVSLVSFHAVMPDGLMIRIPDEDLAPETRMITDLFPPSLDHLDLFLGISVERPDAPNCQLTDTKPSRPTRYRLDYVKVQDHNTGENPKEVPVARKNLRIFCTGEEMADAVVIKIGELIRNPSGAIALRESFIPPLAVISASSYLMKLIRGLLEVMIGKAASLAGVQRAMIEGTTGDIPKFLLLSALNGATPLLSHISQSGKVHPEVLYSILARLAGELATFTTEFQAKDVPLYQHLDLSRTFREFDLRIRRMIENVTPNRYVSIPLSVSRENIWSGSISDEKLIASSQFFLAASGEMAEEQIREMVPRRVKTGALSELDLIVSTAMPGVRLQHSPRPPATLPVKKGQEYFRLENSGEFWNSITKSMTVAFYLPSDMRGMKLELMATKES